MTKKLTFNVKRRDLEDGICDETKDAPSDEDGGKGDIIQKIKDVVTKLPSLWVERPSLGGLFEELFNTKYITHRIKTKGPIALLDTLVTNRAAEYIYATDSIISLLAPNTPVSKLSNAIRNVVLLDSMVDQFTQKIEFSTELIGAADITSALKDAKDCPVKLNDYSIEVVRKVPLLGMFAIMMSQYNVGSVVELHSKWFWISDSQPNGTIHCKLIYKNMTAENTELGYVVRNVTASNLVMVCEIEEYNVKLFLTHYTTPDHKDLTVRHLYPTDMTAYILYSSEEIRNNSSTSWCQAMSFSMVDFSEMILDVYKTHIEAWPRKILTKKATKEIFDKNTDALVNRIIEGNKMYCSRSYAFVGIPGTGKSFIMNKIVKDDKDSVILIPEFTESGFTFEHRNLLSTVISSICQDHIFILLDDFDKVVVDDNGSVGKSTQELIYFFDFLRNECPGGFDNNGNPKKTFTLIATMNNPKALSNAIIKRSERFDEVVEIGLPQTFVYGKRLEMLKDKDDTTDFTKWKFRLVYWYMRHKVITLADIGNIYDIMKTHRPKKCANCAYTVRDLLYAVKYIGKNRSSASKEYEI